MNLIADLTALSATAAADHERQRAEQTEHFQQEARKEFLGYVTAWADTTFGKPFAAQLTWRYDDDPADGTEQAHASIGPGMRIRRVCDGDTETFSAWLLRWCPACDHERADEFETLPQLHRLLSDNDTGTPDLARMQRDLAAMAAFVDEVAQMSRRRAGTAHLADLAEMVDALRLTIGTPPAGGDGA